MLRHQDLNSHNHVHTSLEEAQISLCICLQAVCFFLSSSWKSLIVPLRRDCQHKQCRLQDEKIQNKSTCPNVPGKCDSQ